MNYFLLIFGLICIGIALLLRDDPTFKKPILISRYSAFIVGVTLLIEATLRKPVFFMYVYSRWGHRGVAVTLGILFLGIAVPVFSLSKTTKLRAALAAAVPALLGLLFLIEGLFDAKLICWFFRVMAWPDIEA